MATPEPNAAQNKLDDCVDGSSGTYHEDESNDAIEVSAEGGGFLQVGRLAVIRATVWAWSDGSSDTADFYVADSVDPSPKWVHVGSAKPSGGGAQVLTSPPFQLRGTLMAARVNFRYAGSRSPCSEGAYDDVDDLVFASLPGGPVATDAPTKGPTKVVRESLRWNQ